MATTRSPRRSAALSPSLAGVSGRPASILMSAMSKVSAFPTSFAGRRSPFASVTESE